MKRNIILAVTLSLVLSWVAISMATSEQQKSQKRIAEIQTKTELAISDYERSQELKRQDRREQTQDHYKFYFVIFILIAAIAGVITYRQYRRDLHHKNAALKDFKLNAEKASALTPEPIYQTPPELPNE